VLDVDVDVEVEGVAAADDDVLLLLLLLELPHAARPTARNAALSRMAGNLVIGTAPLELASAAACAANGSMTKTLPRGQHSHEALRGTTVIGSASLRRRTDLPLLARCTRLGVPGVPA
jgi:hypothetical protein